MFDLRVVRDFAVGGVPIMEALRDITGKTDSQLRDMMKNKQLSFELINKAFLHMTSSEGRFHKLLDKMANSAEGLYNNIKVTWDLIKEGVGKKLLKDLKPLLREFKDFLVINKEKIIDKLSKTIVHLSKMLVFLYKTLFKLIKAFMPVINLLAEIVSGIMAIAAAILEFITTNKTFIRTLKIATIVLGVFLAGFVVTKIVAFSKAVQTAGMVVGSLGPTLASGSQNMILLAKSWGKSVWTIVKSLAPLIAAGALIVGMFLVLEDMYVYVTGLMEGEKTDTYTGDILNSLDKGSKELRKKLTDVFSMFTTPLAGWIAMGELLYTYLLGTDEEFDAALAKHANRLNKINEATLRVFNNMGDFIVSPFSEAWDEFTANLEIDLLKLKAAISRFYYSTKNIILIGIEDFITAVKNIITQGFEWVIDKINSFINMLSSAISSIKSIFGMSDKPITANFINSMKTVKSGQNSNTISADRSGSSVSTNNNNYDQSKKQTINDNKTINVYVPNKDIADYMIEKMDSESMSMMVETSGGDNG